jgi:cell division protease FtsH
VTSGAQSDIEQATRLARAMVTRWGYSDELGTVAYGENQEEVFLGHSVSRTQNISEETAQKIDQEVKRLVFAGLSTARKILTEKNADLVTLAQGLLEYETLSGEEIRDLLNGTPPKRDDNDGGRRSSKPSSSVPSAGTPKTGGAGGMEPQPQA